MIGFNISNSLLQCGWPYFLSWPNCCLWVPLFVPPNCIHFKYLWWGHPHHSIHPLHCYPSFHWQYREYQQAFQSGHISQTHHLAILAQFILLWWLTMFICHSYVCLTFLTLRWEMLSLGLFRISFFLTTVTISILLSTGVDLQSVPGRVNPNCTCPIRS